jgi:hypothetical protein
VLRAAAGLVVVVVGVGLGQFSLTFNGATDFMVLPAQPSGVRALSLWLKFSPGVGETVSSINLS